jgi:membrane associated rhomboid family serine protease
MIPIADSTRSRTFPWVNVTLIALNFAVFFYEIAISKQSILGHVTQLDVFIYHWGNISACTVDAWGQHVAQASSADCVAQPHPAWTPLTAMFIHGGWLHILGNMLFLWIFGDNVEDAMGHALYAVFYLLVGLAGACTQMFVNVHDLTPAIGASGAIAGVMAAYLVLFPRATVVVIIPVLFFLPFPVPAFLLIGIWYIAQLMSGFATLGVGTSVGYFAHIGGFFAGALAVNFFAVHRGRARARPVRGLRR